MLAGSLTYRDEHLGEITYDVFAMDSLDDLKLHLMNNNRDYTKYVNGLKLFDKHINEETGEVEYPYDEVDGLADSRGLFIKKTSKFKTTITNKEFCSRISALVRYTQTHKTSNEVVVLQEGDSFNKSKIVEVPNVGVIGYSLGIITSLKISNKFFDLELKDIDDKSLDLSIFKDLKEVDKWGNRLTVTPVSQIGFKLCEELLGFPYTPTVKNLEANVFGMYETIEEVIANNPDKNSDWILDRHYVIVDDSMLDELFEEFMNFDGYVAYDTETSGLKINFKSRSNEGDQLVGVVLSKEVGTGYYFPLQHKLFKNLCDGDHWYFMEKYMKPILENKKIVVHNASFDWKVAHIYGIDTNIVYDTMLAMGVTKRYEQESIELGLKALAKNILGLDMFDLSDFVYGTSFGDSNIAFWDLPYELVRRYAPADADMTLSLFHFFNDYKLLQKYDAERIFKLEVDFAICVAYSEFYGYRIDVDNVPKLREEILFNMDKYQQKMFDIAGREFNPNSPKQLVQIMYKELGIEQKGKKPKTDKDTLKELMEIEDEEGNPKYPFVVYLKKYRDNAGIHKNFLKKLKEFTTDDGYIFPNVLALGTNTGRSSVNNPNYQSYNDPVKKNIVPRPGYAHVDTDFAQIEYRVLASTAAQTVLMRAFDDPDLDYHTYQASRMFGVPYELVTKALRQQSKGVNFGLPYGMGDSSLGARIFGARTKENEIKAAELRRKFFLGQEKIQQFFEVVRSQGVRDGYTSTLYGRRRYYHRGTFTVNEIRRQAGNHVIQGTAADIYKLAVNEMFDEIRKKGWLGLVLFNVFVHDELLMEVHKSIDMYEFLKAWKNRFEVKIEGFCKLYAGVGIGKNWYAAKKQDLPPQYSDILVAKADEPHEWDEDLDKFLKDVEDGYVAYKYDRVEDFIRDENNQGKVIKPAIYSLLMDCLGMILDDVKGEQSKVDKLNSICEQDIFSLDDAGKLQGKLKDLQSILKIFCFNRGLDYTKVNILDFSEANISKEEVDEEEISLDFDSVDNMHIFDNDYIKQALKDGIYADSNTGTIYIREMTLNGQSILLDINNRNILSEHGSWNISVITDKNKPLDSLYTLPFKTNNNGLSIMRGLYVKYSCRGAQQVDLEIPRG